MSYPTQRISRTSAALAALALIGATAACSSSSGASSASGKSDILISEGTVLTGTATAYKALVDGAVAYYDMVNAQGGIDGHKLVVKQQDTGYTTAGTVRVTRAAVGAKSLVVQGLASPAIDALAPYMKTAKNSVWFPIADASLMAPLASNFFSSNAYYSSTGAWAAQFLHSKVPSGKLAVVYQTGPTSEPGAKGAMYWLKQQGITPVDLSFSATDTDLSGVASKLQSEGVKGVFFWGVTPQFASFAHALANNHYKPTVVGTFGLAGAPTLKAAGSAAEGMYFDVLTLPDDQCADGYTEAINKYFPNELSPLTAQGWSAGALVVAGIREALKTHKTIDASALIDGLQHVSGTVGCTAGVSLSPTNHVATTQGAAVQVVNGQLKYVTGFSDFPKVPALK